MKAGQVVMVYEDPFTQQKPEGKARLIKRYQPDVGDGLSTWIVEFLADGYRTIRTVQKAIK